MSSQATKASITLPKVLSTELKKLAKKEHRTLSGLLQEAARCYLRMKEFEQLQQELRVTAMKHGIHSEEDIDNLIHDR